MQPKLSEHGHIPVTSLNLTLYDNRGSVMINEQIERYSMIVLIFM